MVLGMVLVPDSEVVLLADLATLTMRFVIYEMLAVLPSRRRLFY
jgi:hypothetical protein